MKDIYSEQLNEPVTAVKVQVSVMPVQVIQSVLMHPVSIPQAEPLNPDKMNARLIHPSPGKPSRLSIAPTQSYAGE